MNWSFAQRLGRALRRLSQDQGGAALTEFAITLPIFVLLMTGLMQLGHMGQTTVAVKTSAYGGMWEESYRLTQATIDDEPGVYSPRSQLMDAVPEGVSAPEVVEGLDAAAAAVGGHWGEAMFKANLALVLSGGQINHRDKDTDAATRLTEKVNITSEPHMVMTKIIGENRDHRPSFAVNDNLADDNIANHFDDTEGVSGVISSALSSVLTASGVVPGLFAGVRNGDAESEATSTVEYSNRFLPHEATYRAKYVTGLSPYAGDTSAIPGFDIDFGSFGREQAQWLFYYATGQTVTNKQVSLNLLELEYDDAEVFHKPERYP